MTNGSTQHNSNTSAAAQKASFCFCISAGDTHQRPSVSLQLTDLTTSFRS